MLLMIYCTAALTSFSDSISYITFIFGRIAKGVRAVILKSDVSLIVSVILNVPESNF